VSGGHTQLMQVDGFGAYRLLGETQDDAAGEAFDKTAQLLGLGYPGGPAVSRLAEFGVAGAFVFPRPMLHSRDLNFSFSGLKTAVLTAVRNAGNLCEQLRADIARAFVDAVVEVLVRKSLAALARTGLRRLVFDAVPMQLKLAITAGIGLFILFSLLGFARSLLNLIDWMNDNDEKWLRRQMEPPAPGSFSR